MRLLLVDECSRKRAYDIDVAVVGEHVQHTNNVIMVKVLHDQDIVRNHSMHRVRILEPGAPFAPFQ